MFECLNILFQSSNILFGGHLIGQQGGVSLGQHLSLFRGHTGCRQAGDEFMCVKRKKSHGCIIPRFITYDKQVRQIRRRG